MSGVNFPEVKDRELKPTRGQRFAGIPERIRVMRERCRVENYWRFGLQGLV